MSQISYMGNGQDWSDGVNADGTVMDLMIT